GNTLFGGSGGTSFLIKVTIVLSIVFALLTLSLVVFGSRRMFAGTGTTTETGSSSGGRIELQPYIGEYTQGLSDEDTSGVGEDDYYQSLLLTTDTIKDTLSALEIQEDTTGGVEALDSSSSDSI
ncbi:preprotein translocase subunit SecG, partial [candidate division WOR-3 bacterium]|nr:preprotein translocase subunit SecG [candidate division WOR-3 bacterium]